MTLEVVGETWHVHKSQTAVVRTLEIVGNLVVSPELSFIELRGTLSAQDHFFYELRFLISGLVVLQARLVEGA